MLYSPHYVDMKCEWNTASYSEWWWQFAVKKQVEVGAIKAENLQKHSL